MEEQKVTKAQVSTELAELRGIVSELSEKVSQTSPNRGGGRISKRTNEHFVILREYATEDGEVKGIVNKMYEVKEVKDTQEAKKYKGICTLDIVNPKTGAQETIKNVDWLQFLDQANRVKAKIIKWDKSQRFETDPRKGGGGTGAVYKQGPNNEYLVDTEFDFEVSYVDHEFVVSIEDGAFTGETFKSDGRAFNL